MNSTETVERESTEVISNNGSESSISEVRSEPRERSEKSQSFRQNLKANLKAPDGVAKDKADVPVTAKPSHSTTEAIPTKYTSSNGTTPSVVTQSTSIAPPADMSGAEKENFTKLTPEMQQYISRRSYEQRNDYTQKTMAASAKEKELNDVYSVVSPIRDEYAKQGIAVPDLVRRAVAWDKAFKTNKVAAAIDYLDSYGINVNDLMQARQEPAAPQYLTHEDAERLADERLEKKLKIMQDERIAGQNFNMVQSFISSKPLFKDIGTAHQLETEMAPIVAGLRSQKPNAPVQELLETAYNYVTKGHPVFSNLTSSLAAKQEIDKLSAQTERSKAASRSISGGPGSGTPKVKSENFRENLRRNLNR